MTPKCSVKGCRRVCRLKTYTKRGKRFHDVCDTHFTRPGALVTVGDALRVIQEVKKYIPDAEQIELVVPKELIEDIEGDLSRYGIMRRDENHDRTD